MCEKSKLIPTINNLVKYISIGNSYALQPSEYQCKKTSGKLTIPRKVFSDNPRGLLAFFPPTNYMKSFVTCKLRNTTQEN